MTDLTYDPFKPLKAKLRKALAESPRGTQRRISEATGIPEPSISEFKTSGMGLELENLAAVARCFGIEIVVMLKKASRSPDLPRHTSGITLPAKAVLYKAGANAPDEVDARVRQLQAENDYLRSVLATFDERCDQTKADIADSLAFRAVTEAPAPEARPRPIHSGRGKSSAR